MLTFFASSWICNANSLVGAITRARGCTFESPSLPAPSNRIKDIIGSKYAAVFPVCMRLVIIIIVIIV